MRPKSTASTTTPSRRSAKGRRAKGKLQNTIVKAKVNAVRTGRKLKNGKGREEIEDLLEKTANDSNLNGSFTGTNTPSDPNYKVARVARQLKKVRSYINLKQSHSKLTNGSSNNSTPTRRSTRNSIATSGTSNGNTNGHHKQEEDIEQAEEAMETIDGKPPGMLKRTISKIWNTGASYENIDEPEKKNGSKEEETSKKENGTSEATSTCVVS